MYYNTIIIHLLLAAFLKSIHPFDPEKYLSLLLFYLLILLEINHVF